VHFKVYLAGDPIGSRAQGLSLIVDAGSPASLPRHLPNRPWRYVATMSDLDAAFAGRRDVIGAALAKRGFFATARLFAPVAPFAHASLVPRTTSRRINQHRRHPVAPAFLAA
jgi:hypothetical protein